MYQSSKAHEIRHRLATEVGRSTLRGRTPGTGSLGRTAVAAAALSVLPLVVMVAASYPAVAVVAVALVVGAGRLRRYAQEVGETTAARSRSKEPKRSRPVPGSN